MATNARITDDDLMVADRITAGMAAAYLGIGEQSCRVLARSGRIGEPIPGTNRVMFQPRKMIGFKRGEDTEDRFARVSRILRNEGVTDVANRIAIAILKIADEMVETGKADAHDH